MNFFASQYRARPSLGLVPDGKRSVKPVPKDLLKLVSKPKNRTIEIKGVGTDPERDTVPFMKKKIRRCVDQVQKLAEKLTGSSVMETVRNDWNFVFNHIQYVEDPQTIESVRDAARTIHDAKGDCDCYTVLLGSLLQAQRIPFKIRIAAYESRGEWGHVYIVVPNGGKDIIVDPVVHKFNYEAPFVDKKDFDMKLVSLEGTQQAPACKPIDNRAKLRRYVNTEQVVQWGFVPTQQFLEENQIPYTQIASTDEESSKLVVNTADGEIALPTIIPPDMAEKVKALIIGAKDKAQQLKKDYKWLWWVAGGLALWMIFGGDKKKEKESEPTGGGQLSGIPSLEGRSKKKKKRQAKKLATVQL